MKIVYETGTNDRYPMTRVCSSSELFKVVLQELHNGVTGCYLFISFLGGLRGGLIFARTSFNKIVTMVICECHEIINVFTEKSVV